MPVRVYVCVRIVNKLISRRVGKWGGENLVAIPVSNTQSGGNIINPTMHQCAGVNGGQQ